VADEFVVQRFDEAGINDCCTDAQFFQPLRRFQGRVDPVADGEKKQVFTLPQEFALAGFKTFFRLFTADADTGSPG